MGNEVKPILIVFEGVDKSGKTTLKDEFNKTTNFKYVVLDRLTTSSKVYNKAFGRDRNKYYEDVRKAFARSFNVLEVLCICSTDEIKKRLDEANEKLPDELKDIIHVQSDFLIEVIKSDGFNNMIIDTTRNIDECVKDIVDKVREMEWMQECRIK